MRIEDKRKEISGVTFEDIQVGECFIDEDDDLCMKIEENNHTYCNAVVLSTGLLWSCSDGYPVTRVKTHIVIESEE